MLDPRPYQREAVDALFTYWHGGGGNGLIVIPTGGGKSLIIAKLLKELLDSWPTLRIHVVTHVKELVAQNLMELLKEWPGAPAGIYSAGLGRRDAHARILFASIQSIWNKIGGAIEAPDVVLVDEAHLISENANTMYGKYFGSCRLRIPDMRIAGFTATDYRLDSGRLASGAGRLFDDVVYEAEVSELIKQGYLSSLISKGMANAIDVSGVAKRGGEFVPGALQKAAMDIDIVAGAVTETVSFGHDRHGWLAFCTGVEHAEQVRDEFRKHGITCEAVHSKIGNGERDRHIQAFREKRVKCLTSVAVLTTGFNVPHVDLIAMLRPTMSTGLYVQMVGRGFRRAPGKENCLVLDFAGNTRRHGPVDAVVVREPGEGGGDAPVKECPTCHSLIHASLMTCPDCGHVFPRDEEPKHKARAFQDVILAKNVQPRWLTVDETSLYKHEKIGAPPSLRMEYRCGPTVHREWLPLERQGYAREKAGQIWRRMNGQLPVPETVDEAIRRKGELTLPLQIMVRPNGKYYEVINRSLTMMEAAQAEEKRGPAKLDDEIPF